MPRELLMSGAPSDEFTTWTTPASATAYLTCKQKSKSGKRAQKEIIMADEHQEQQNLVYVSAQEAQAYAERVLQANGLTPANATTVARGLVAADLRGIDTHGINRLPSYLTRIRQGVLDPSAEPTLHVKTPVAAQIDAHNNFGFIAAAQGIQHACTVAQTYGIGMVSIKHSNHFGMSAHLCQTALDHPSGPMMSLVFTNSSPALPPYGGRSKLLGVSPIACGAPGGPNHPDFILDMAPSVAARGKIYKALRRGEKIPMDWALDATGAPTDDPAKALEEGAVMLPMGGPKGSALAIMMDVFSGVFSGAAFAGGVTGPYDPSRPADVGHFLVCIRPDLFMSRAEFGERMDVLYERVTEGERAKGVERIYMPGELEQITERKRREEGIPFVKGEVEGLDAEARKCGVEGLRVM
ncbi:hypothetical protein D0868_15541 [Hortaea werneckii]|uniref:Malate/L-lactate dehydrogenase n=2 Tax=Hortaea werneckii TaxID=91943 RepID=A0A3M6X0J7_HORWE|nr:hypothetical protein D0868_15541 [Hortaea werneckii]